LRNSSQSGEYCAVQGKKLECAAASMSGSMRKAKAQARVPALHNPELIRVHQI
jgi:hypothetical protein